MKREWYAVVRMADHDENVAMRVYPDCAEAEVRARYMEYEYPTLGPYIVVPMAVTGPLA